MKLIIAIVNADDKRVLLDSLLHKGFRATVVSTTGGFLREGNATILVGTETDKMEAALEVIKENCHTRTQFVNPLPPIMEPGELYMPTPVEVQVGGAAVFVLDVERHERF